MSTSAASSCEVKNDAAPLAPQQPTPTAAAPLETTPTPAKPAEQSSSVAPLPPKQQDQSKEEPLPEAPDAHPEPTPSGQEEEEGVTDLGGGGADSAEEEDPVEEDPQPQPQPPVPSGSSQRKEKKAEKAKTTPQPKPKLPEEYRVAASQVAISQALMSHSSLRTRLRWLKAEMARQPQLMGPRAPAFAKLLRDTVEVTVKAAKGPSGAQAVAGLVSAQLYEKGNLFFHRAGLLQPFLHSALLVLRQTQPPASLYNILKIMAQGADAEECMRLSCLRAVMARLPQEATTLPALPPPKARLSPEGAKARAKLYWAAVEVLEEFKEKAFVAAFVSPTKLYFRATGDKASEQRVDTHGITLYHQLLVASVGARLSHSLNPACPVAGVADFLQAKMGSGLRVLDHPKNFGKPLAAILAEVEVRNALRGVAVVGQVLPPEGLFPLRGKTASEVVAQALSEDPSAAPGRAAVAKYISRFTSYFTAAKVLPQLFGELMARESTRRLMGTVYEELKAHRGSSSSSSSAPPRPASSSSSSSSAAPRVPLAPTGPNASSRAGRSSQRQAARSASTGRAPSQDGKGVGVAKAARGAGGVGAPLAPTVQEFVWGPQAKGKAPVLLLGHLVELFQFIGVAKARE